MSKRSIDSLDRTFVSVLRGVNKREVDTSLREGEDFLSNSNSGDTLQKHEIPSQGKKVIFYGIEKFDMIKDSIFYEVSEYTIQLAKFRSQEKLMICKTYPKDKFYIMKECYLHEIALNGSLSTNGGITVSAYPVVPLKFRSEDDKAFYLFYDYFKIDSTLGSLYEQTLHYERSSPKEGKNKLEGRNVLFDLFEDNTQKYYFLVQLLILLKNINKQGLAVCEISLRNLVAFDRNNGLQQKSYRSILKGHFDENTPSNSIKSATKPHLQKNKKDKIDVDYSYMKNSILRFFDLNTLTPHSTRFGISLRGDYRIPELDPRSSEKITDSSDSYLFGKIVLKVLEKNSPKYINFSIDKNTGIGNQQLKSFLIKCLQKSPEKRLSIFKLEGDEFISTILQKLKNNKEFYYSLSFSTRREINKLESSSKALIELNRDPKDEYLSPPKPKAKKLKNYEELSAIFVVQEEASQTNFSSINNDDNIYKESKKSKNPFNAKEEFGSISDFSEEEVKDTKDFKRRYSSQTTRKQNQKLAIFNSPQLQNQYLEHSKVQNSIKFDRLSRNKSGSNLSQFKKAHNPLKESPIKRSKSTNLLVKGSKLEGPRIAKKQRRRFWFNNGGEDDNRVTQRRAQQSNKGDISAGINKQKGGFVSYFSKFFQCCTAR